MEENLIRDVSRESIDMEKEGIGKSKLNKFIIIVPIIALIITLIIIIISIIFVVNNKGK